MKDAVCKVWKISRKVERVTEGRGTKQKKPEDKSVKDRVTSINITEYNE